MEQGDSPEQIKPKQTLADRFVRPVVDKFQRLRDERTSIVDSQNPFGFTTPDFRDISNEEKRQLWTTQGGQEFEGEMGEVKRYVIGIPPKAVEEIRTSGFDVSKKRPMSGTFGNILPFLGKVLGSTEGKGIYATTNPELGSREYGPSLAVVDIALGKTVSPDNSTAFRLLNILHGPLKFGTFAAYTTSLSAYMYTVWAGHIGNT